MIFFGPTCATTGDDFSGRLERFETPLACLSVTKQNMLPEQMVYWVLAAHACCRVWVPRLRLMFCPV